MEALFGILKNPGETIATVVMVCMALNFALSGLAKALELIKDKTTTDADNKALVTINKIVTVLAQIVDWLAPRTTPKA